MKGSYSYSVLQYRHDVATGEFVNVGIVAFKPSERELVTQVRTSYGRITNLFPSLDGKMLRSHLSFVRSEFDSISKKLRQELQFEEVGSLCSILDDVLPPDDGCFRWSEIGFGDSDDLNTTVRSLFDRLVSKYDDHSKQKGRDDEAVWKQFKSAPALKRVLPRLTQKRITVDGEDYTFEYAFKNGCWNVLEPVSLDLGTSEGIKGKAQRILGSTMVMSSAKEDLKMYLLTGKPKSRSLYKPFDSALKILDRIPLPKEIVLEEDTKQFSERIAQVIEAHAG